MKRSKTFQDGAKQFHLLKDEEKVDVLISGMTFMQANNKLSMTEALMFALDYEPVDNSHNTLWKNRTPQSC